MNYTLHKLPEGFIITSDKKQQVELGKLYYESDNTAPIYSFTKETLPEQYYLYEVIAQQDQIDFSSLLEEEQKEIGYFDIEKLAANKWNKLNKEGSKQSEKYLLHPSFKFGYTKGFQKAQFLLSDRRFTLEDMQGFVLWLNNNWRRGKSGWRHVGDFYKQHKPVKTEFLMSKYIQSLSQPKSFNIEGEWVGDKFKITKLL